MKASLLVLAILVSSCGSPAGTQSPAPATPSATVAAVTSPPTPSASRTAGTIAFPDLPFIVGTAAGDLYFQIKDGQPTGRKVHVCGNAVRNLVASAGHVAFVCGASGNETLYVYDDATGKTRTIAKTDITWPGAAFTASEGLVYVTLGAEVPTAPIPMTKLVLFDLTTGATTTIDERFGVAFDVSQSAAGVAVWRPQNSLSFTRPEPDAGTWVLRGTSLTRLSLHRLVAGTGGRYLLESEPRDGSGYLSSSGSGSTFVVLRTERETRVTPLDISSEQAVDVLPDGRVVAWRPQNGPFDGAMVVYRAGAVVRQDRGLFSTFHLIHAADWVVGIEISGPPATTYRAYRFSDGAFASIPAGSITSLAISSH
jgi:hypothetical protein